jgi:hypothetical protein
MMFMLKSTHRKLLAEAEAEIGDVERNLIKEVARCNRITAKLLTMTRERDAALAKIARMQGGLKQYRKPGAVAPVLKAVG